MPLINTTIDKIILQAEPVRNDSDYISQSDNLLYCGKCHTPKQCIVTLPQRGETIVGCICKCESDKRELEKQRQLEAERQNYIQVLRDDGLADNLYSHFRFENDDGNQPELSKAHAYVNHWNILKDNNSGLLLWGGVGTGKSFFAGCIANALIDRCIPAKMTNFSTILNALSGLYSEDKNRYISRLCSCDLLVIDDFGIERKTEYALEQVFGVIDYRYRTMKPLIITTNLPLTHFKNPIDTAHARIYSRILEMCLPICLNGKDRRRQIGSHKLEITKALLTGQEETV